MSKVKKKPIKEMYVQGAWLKLTDKDILKMEAKQTGLRSTTQLASKILQKWITSKKLERARETVREADHG